MLPATRFNVRVAECRLAAQLLQHLLLHLIIQRFAVCIRFNVRVAECRLAAQLIQHQLRSQHQGSGLQGDGSVRCVLFQ